jgi:tripartite-type tricarboxylate transporter receptor subunit TctC
MKIFSTLVLGLALALVAHGAGAQNYPTKSVRMIVPFPPGAATDVAARVIGASLAQELGQPFVVENKPGAGGSIGGSEVAHAAPDGYTLLFASNSAVASNVALLKNIPYDPMKDFTPVAGVAETVLVLMVRADSPAKDLKSFVALAKERSKGKWSAGYGSSSSQVCISMVDTLAGTKTLPVPYKGIPLAVNDLLGGQVDYTFVDLGNAIAQAKGGKLRALGVSSAKRSPIVPDWPALAEVIPGYEITAWFAVVGPPKMPKPVVDRLNAAITKALTQPDSKEKLAAIGLTPFPLAPDKLHAFMGAEIDKWKKLVKEAGIEPE